MRQTCSRFGNKYVIAYLLAIAAANLLVARFGKSMVVINAFSFIGLDLTARDKLHDAWNNRHLWLKMGALVSSGSCLSWFLNRGAAQIAIASFVAFALAGIADTICYHLLGKHAHLIRVNGSNLVSAAVDSLVFPWLAFGNILPILTFWQFVAKVAGGYLWSRLLFRNGEKK